MGSGSADGGGGTSGEPGSGINLGVGSSAVLGTPAPAGAKKTAPPAAPLGRILGNRDWLIYIECTAEGVVVKQGNQKFSVESLAKQTSGEHPLVKAVQQMIERRQATVRAGEPPYRPMLRFQVRPDGLRSYYLAYPLFGNTRLPMARENLQKPPDS